jgi:hypothetical protein
LPLTRRWFNGSSRDLTLEPIGVLEYIIPADWRRRSNTASGARVSC